MPEWNSDYYATLQTRFNSLVGSVPREVSPSGRVAPSLEDIPIGTGRSLRGAVLFFDIRGFTARTSSSEPADLFKTLQMLDCVIPTVMQIVYDFGGYVEKNTGDGIMALVGIGEDDATSANAAIDVALTIFYVLKHIVNPVLVRAGMAAVDARIGMDMGDLLIARIGVPTGSSDHPRNFLTAVGPPANIACKLQGMAGTNQIWVGDLAKRAAHSYRQEGFVRQDAANTEWTWVYKGTQTRYAYWNYDRVRRDPNAN